MSAALSTLTHYGRIPFADVRVKSGEGVASRKDSDMSVSLFFDDIVAASPRVSILGKGEIQAGTCVDDAPVCRASPSAVSLDGLLSTVSRGRNLGSSN